jgi:PH domain
MHGYLSKLGDGIVRLYRKRWFVLESDNMLCYYAGKEGQLRGKIDLSQILHVRPSTVPEQNAKVKIINHDSFDLQCQFYFNFSSRKKIKKYYPLVHIDLLLFVGCMGI